MLLITKLSVQATYPETPDGEKISRAPPHHIQNSAKFAKDISKRSTIILQTMFKLFITHTPHGVCYLLAKDLQGNMIYKFSITPTVYFDLRGLSIPEIIND